MRTTVRDAAARAFLTLTRGVLKVANDKPFWQEVDIALHADEVIKKVERVQQYGFTSYPLKEKDAKDKHPADIVVGFMNGNRTHPIVIACDDRRHRLFNMKDEGGVAMYDYKNQRCYLHKDGMEFLTEQPIVHRVVHKPEEEEKKNQSQSEKDGSKQDAQKKQKDFTRIIQDKKSIKFQILDEQDDTKVVCYIELDKNGITYFGPTLTSKAGLDIVDEAKRDITSTAQRDLKGTAIERELVMTAPKVFTDGETHLDRGDALIELYLDTSATRVYAK